MEAVHSKSRRRHGTQFKQEVLAACDQPGASVAGVALALPAAQAEAAADIRIEVRRGALAVNMSWPSTGAANCAAWLRELLR